MVLIVIPGFDVEDDFLNPVNGIATVAVWIAVVTRFGLQLQVRIIALEVFDELIDQSIQ